MEIAKPARPAQVKANAMVVLTAKRVLKKIAVNFRDFTELIVAAASDRQSDTRWLKPIVIKNTEAGLIGSIAEVMHPASSPCLLATSCSRPFGGNGTVEYIYMHLCITAYTRMNF